MTNTSTTTLLSAEGSSVDGDGRCVAFTLAEVLAQGPFEAETDRQAWVSGRVSKPCLVVQVDVWQEFATSSDNDDEEEAEDVDVMPLRLKKSIQHLWGRWRT